MNYFHGNSIGEFPLKTPATRPLQRLLVRLAGKRYAYSDGHYVSVFRAFRGRFYLEKMEPRPDYIDWSKVL